jgi:hypothetical protein
MLQRALRLNRSGLTVGERLGLYKLAEAVGLLRDLRNRLLRLLRLLSEFIARGGPLS